MGGRREGKYVSYSAIYAQSDRVRPFDAVTPLQAGLRREKKGAETTRLPTIRQLGISVDARNPG